MILPCCCMVDSPLIECSVALSIDRLRTGGDLGQFLGNGSLTSVIIGQREVFDKIVGIIGRIHHREHSGGLLAGPRVDDRLEDLRLEQTSGGNVEQYFRVWFKLRLGRPADFGYYRQELTQYDFLANRRAELSIDDI